MLSTDHLQAKPVQLQGHTIGCSNSKTDHQLRYPHYQTGPDVNVERAAQVMVCPEGLTEGQPCASRAAGKQSAR